MSMVDTWAWLGPLIEYTMAIFMIITAIFFFLAVYRKENARRYGIICGISAIMVFVVLVTVTTGNVYWGTTLGAMMGTFQLTLSIVYLITGIALVYFALDAKNNVQHKEAYYSTMLIALIFFGLSMYLLIPSAILLINGIPIPADLVDLIPIYSLIYVFPVARIVLVIIPLTAYAVGIYTLMEMKLKTYEKEPMREADRYQKTFSKIDLEISRKLYHVIIIVVIIAYLFLGEIVMKSIYQFTLIELPTHESLPLGPVIYNEVETSVLDFRAGHLLLIMAVSWIMVILLFTDFVRLKKYRYYPFKMLAKIYRDKERRVLAPHIFLTTGVLFVVILSSGIDLALGATLISAQIVAITIMVSALADAVATIVGITKGKHHLKGGKSKKTWEGWIAGFASAFIFGMVSFFALMLLYSQNFLEGIVLSLVAATVFGVIDYVSPPISDNVLNPVLIGLALWGVAFLFPL